jgi:NADPH:quinone reductase-like Zn-dependent oxidoreductase
MFCGAAKESRSFAALRMTRFADVGDGMGAMATALQLKSFGLVGLALAEVEAAAPGAGEVLVELHAASLNYRDLMVVRGTYDPKMKLPRVLGSDAAGVVAAVGQGVTRFKVGDRVCSLFFQTWQDGEILGATSKSALGGPIDGVFTTARLFPETGLIHAPAGMSHEEAATLPCAALTAWNALVEKGRVRAGETVLLLGTGGVSLFALQIAKMHGARVILTSSSDEKLERGRAMGADETINYREHPDWDAEVFRLTAKHGVDHVVEVGGNGTLPRSLRAVRVSGQVHLIGVLAGGGSEVDVRQIFAKSIYVNGVYVGSAAMFARLNAALEANGTRPVIDRVFALSEARAAFEHLQGGSHFGKIVLSLRG